MSVHHSLPGWGPGTLLSQSGSSSLQQGQNLPPSSGRLCLCVVSAVQHEGMLTQSPPHVTLQSRCPLSWQRAPSPPQALAPPGMSRHSSSNLVTPQRGSPPGQTCLLRASDLTTHPGHPQVTSFTPAVLATSWCSCSLKCRTIPTWQPSSDQPRAHPAWVPSSPQALAAASCHPLCTCGRLAPTVLTWRAGELAPGWTSCPCPNPPPHHPGDILGPCGWDFSKARSLD